MKRAKHTTILPRISRPMIASGFTLLLVLGSCASTPRVSTTEDVCRIFAENPDWYAAGMQSARKWNAPLHVQMAIIRQESSFNGIARPPKKYVAGMVPWGHQSSAYGYAQAIDGTWDWYKKDTGARGASRDDFRDAVDFVGWYMNKTRQINGLSMDDAFSHYLAYHEGHTGYKRATYRGKAFLTKAASRVARTSNQYRLQLNGCATSLSTYKNGWFS